MEGGRVKKGKKSETVREVWRSNRKRYIRPVARGGALGANAPPRRKPSPLLRWPSIFNYMWYLPCCAKKY